MTPALTPLVGLFFEGATLTEHDEIAPGAALVGKPTWSRSELQRNLELRLGLPSPAMSEAVRVQRFARRMREILVEAPNTFYARSFALDSLGTATTVLAWRDTLVVCGWNGEPIPNGGERLEALHAIEVGLTMPIGVADRLRLIEQELQTTTVRPLDELLLAEARAL